MAFKSEIERKTENSGISFEVRFLDCTILVGLAKKKYFHAMVTGFQFNSV